MAAPWHVLMFARHGSAALGALLVPFDPWFAHKTGVLARLVDLAPASLTLGLFAAVRMIRLALIDEDESPAIVGGVFWVLWLAVALLLPVVWPSGPRSLLELSLLVPLSLLAASAIADLANRRIPVRTLNWLAPATAVCVAWLNSSTAVIGVGVRVNRDGALQVAEVLKRQGVELLIVDLTGYDIHLDVSF